MKKALTLFPILTVLVAFHLFVSAVFATPANDPKAPTKKGDGGYEITIKIKDYKDKTLYLGNYYGDKKYIKDTCIIKPGMPIVFKGAERLHEGIYLVVTPSMKYFELLIGENQHFSVETDTTDFVRFLKINNSMENDLFLDYLNFSTKAGMEMDQLNRQYPAMKSNKADSARIIKQMLAIDSNMKVYREQFIIKHPKVILANVFRAMPEPKVPDFPRLANGRRDSVNEFNYFRNHFFDHFDFSDERLLYTPLYHAKVDKYLNQLTVQHPDSIIASCDYLVAKSKANKEMFKWMVWYLTNTYENSKIMGYDAVFAHMGETYYGKGEAYWIDSAKLKKIVDRVNIVKRTIIGATVQNMMLQDSSAVNHNLYDVMKGKYTLIWIWNSTCGHCQKETPELLELYEKIHKKDDINVITITEERVTNKDDPQMKSWKKYLKEHPNPWYNLRDMNNYYDFKIIFDAYATPKLFIIDSATKKIVAKQLGINQVEDWLEKTIKMEQAKKK